MLLFHFKILPLIILLILKDLAISLSLVGLVNLLNFSSKVFNQKLLFTFEGLQLYENRFFRKFILLIMSLKVKQCLQSALLRLTYSIKPSCLSFKVCFTIRLIYIILKIQFHLNYQFLRD